MEWSGEISETASQMFQRLFRTGVRPAGSARLPGTGWDWNTFRQRILASTANKQRARPKNDISERTFGNWKAGKPTDNTTVEAMAEVFFGEDPALAEEKRRFLAIWPRKGKPAPHQSVAETRDTTGTQEQNWEITQHLTNRPLLDHAIEPPSQNKTRELFDLLASLRPGMDPCRNIEPNYEMGLTQFSVAYEAVGCRPTGPRAGDGNNERTGVRSSSNRWIFTAHDASSPPDRFFDVLATFVPDGSGAAPSVTLEAFAHTEHLKPHPLGEADTLPGKTKAVINQYIKHHSYPRKGLIPLGTNTIRWKGKP